MVFKAHSRPWGLFALLFTLLVIVTFWPATGALGKNVYEIHDGTEGDPGDGVLRPRPEIIEPGPAPSPRTVYPLLIMDTWKQGSFLILPLVSYGQIAPVGLTGEIRGRLIPVGRWHDAP